MVLLQQCKPRLQAVIFIWKGAAHKSRVQLLIGCIEFSWGPIFHFPGVESKGDRLEVWRDLSWTCF